MTTICIFKNGKLDMEYDDVTISDFTSCCDIGMRCESTITFSYAEASTFNRKEIWTGKFICIANGSTRRRYTPGKIYTATEYDVSDDTATNNIRGINSAFPKSVGSFKELQEEFRRNGICIIEFKGEEGIK